MNEYDIVIIGSGMGGLTCAGILAKEGYRVCVLEKNKQIGGCLQTYVRNKVIFDAGVHYLGGLDKGQNLYQIFTYLGIMDKLKLKQLDKNAFDKIIINNDGNEYALAQGYENFIQQLLLNFPNEETALRLYCNKIKEVCSKFPLYNLRSGGSFNEKNEVLEIETRSFIESITHDKKLQAVLAGNNMLYVLQSGKTPFYVHALILNSYIESAWKCIDGGSVIGKLLAKTLREHGGEIHRNAEVKKIIVAHEKAIGVQLANGTQINGKKIISNMHPVKTLEITETSLIKSIYTNRLKSLENSVGSFIINIVFKKNTFSYFKHNYYWHKEGHVWNLDKHTEENWPLCYMLFCSESSKQQEYADSATLFAYMRYEEVQQWENTFNTVSTNEHRGDAYEAFKKKKAELLFDTVEEKFPGLKNCIEAYYTATPLSYRDYIGTNDGAIYGIVKDCNNPLKTFVPPHTKVPNLYLTGQNLNLHGILGTAISALVTCIAIMGNETIIEKIKNA